MDVSAQARHRLYLALPTGLLALAGTGCIAYGSYRPLTPGGPSQRAVPAWPSFWLLLALAGVTGLAGLATIIGGRLQGGRLGLGAVILPGLTLAGYEGAWLQSRLGPAVRAGGYHATDLGAQLLVLGVGLVGLAALLALGQLAAGSVDRRGVTVYVGLVAAGGLAQVWLLSGVAWPGSGLLSGSDLAAVAGSDTIGWSTVTLLGAVVAGVAATGFTAAREGTAAVGSALGGFAVLACVGAVRLLVDPPAAALVGAPVAVHRSGAALIVVGAGALAYLLLALVVRTRLVVPPAPEPGDWAADDSWLRTDPDVSRMEFPDWQQPSHVNPVSAPEQERLAGREEPTQRD